METPEEDEIGSLQHRKRRGPADQPSALRLPNAREADMGWESVGSELHETFFTSDEVVVAVVVTQVGM